MKIFYKLKMKITKIFIINIFFLNIFLSKTKIAEEQEIKRIRIDANLPKDYLNYLTYSDQLNFKFNHAMPHTDEYFKLMH